MTIGVPKNRIIAQTFTQEVEVFQFRSPVNDFGKPAGNKTESVGKVLANITEMDGTCLIQYRESGVLNPVRISMNYIGFLPSHIVWRGKHIAVKSFIEQDNFLKRRSVMLGDLVIPLNVKK